MLNQFNAFYRPGFPFVNHVLFGMPGSSIESMTGRENSARDGTEANSCPSCQRNSWNGPYCATSTGCTGALCLRISFLVGSLMFLGGGIMECLENVPKNVTCSESVGPGSLHQAVQQHTRTAHGARIAVKWLSGWWGASLNTLGGLGFTVGVLFFSSSK